MKADAGRDSLTVLVRDRDFNPQSALIDLECLCGAIGEGESRRQAVQTWFMAVVKMDFFLALKNHVPGAQPAVSMGGMKLLRVIFRKGVAAPVKSKLAARYGAGKGHQGKTPHAGGLLRLDIPVACGSEKIRPFAFHIVSKTGN
jgi:hypothetical protein